MQKTVRQAFVDDDWSLVDQSPLEGVQRIPVPAYRLSDQDEPIVIMRYTDRQEDEASDVFTVETRVISDADLDNSLAITITVTVGNALDPIPVHSDQVKDYMAKESLTQLFCHPAMKLPEGLGATRHMTFPKPDSEDTYDVFACTKKAGVIVSVPNQNGSVARGFFLRTKQFRRIRLLSPVPSALDFILGEDD